MLKRLIASLFNYLDRRSRAVEKREERPSDSVAPVKAPTAAGAPPLPTEPPGNRPEGIADRSVLCREVVLDREQRVIGYEFMLRGSVRDRVLGQSQRILLHAYNAVVIQNLLQFSIHQRLGHRLSFITVLDSFLANPLIGQLPGSGVALTVTFMNDAEHRVPDALVERVRELKKLGFKFGLEQSLEGMGFETLAPLADYLIFRTARHNPADLKKRVEQCGRYYPTAQLVARDVESLDDLELCRKLGFALFQGPFVTRREDWSGNQAQPGTLQVCDLLNHLRRDAETVDLAQLLKQDAVLSYRLLRYINSAAFGRRQTIASIEQALVFMGRQKMYRWLTLLLLGSVQNSLRGNALQENALARARFMELIGENAFAEAERDSLFVTGLFSMLDLVLQLPLPEALKPLRLPEAIRAALLRDAGPYASFLDLAVACESSDQDRIEAAAERCGVGIGEVNAKYFEALAWVQAIEGQDSGLAFS
jgi:EAL and modified HD-GYP domain-containing signal transduction protein